MRATVSHFEIPAQDMERAARFYREVFGWSVERLPWEGYPYFKVRGSAGEGQKDGIEGGLLPADVAATDHPLLVLHITEADLEDCLRKIEDAGGRIDRPAEDVGGMGRFARFRDSEGNLMGLWQAGG